MNLNEHSFTERMEEAKAIALRERNRGMVSKPKYAKPEPLEDTAENRLLCEIRDLRQELGERDNEIAVLRLHRAEDHGAAFDVLAQSKQDTRPVMPKALEQEAMNSHQFLKALKKLGLSHASKRTAALLGLSVRRVQDIAAGANAPKPVALLLSMYLAHGLPEDEG